MKKLAFSLAAILSFIVGIAGCGSSHSGSSILAAVVAPSFKTAPQADLTGQTDFFTGQLGSGATATFAAIQGVTYNISVSSSPSNEDIIVDIFTSDGAELKAKTITTNGGLDYFHASQSQHVLVVVRPYNPANTGVNVTSCKVTSIGPYSQTALSVNVVVAGDDFAGFGQFNDLASAQDRANLAATLVQKMQALHDLNATGIKFTFEGFTLTTAQVKAVQPTLVDTAGHTVCQTSPEQVNSSGYSNINTGDVDKWGSFGFPANDPTPTRANGLDVFIIHHFSTDGVVGLSPRPGAALAGNGPGTAVCVGAFLQSGGKIVGARSVDDMAVVLTHEIGHFLGLLHTTTFSPTSTAGQVTEAIDDGLSDTPAAGTIKDANGDGVVGIGDGCADESYIMFYQSIPTQSVFSPKQISIMKTTLSSLAH